MSGTLNRRALLGAGLAVPFVGAVSLQAASKPSSPEAQPNRKIRVAVIGVGGRGTIFLNACLKRKDTDVTALCDINPEAASHGAALVKAAFGREPVLHVKGPENYRMLLQRDDVDAVFVTTPADSHAAIATAALQADKWVFSEVPACYTIREGWDLIQAAQRSRGQYMLGENYCLTQPNMLVLNMVGRGVFGTLTYGECGYIHDCRDILFEKGGELTWRGRMSSDPRFGGDAYPTHSVGPMAMWLGITRGDRFTRCVALQSQSLARREYAVRRFGADSPQARIDTWRADSVVCLLQTESGALVVVRYDAASDRPHHMAMYTLQGTRGAYDDSRGIYIAGKSQGWEPVSKHQGEYEHPWWCRHGDQARAGGHGGGDYFTVEHFLDCVHKDRTPAIDVYDAVTWSALAELSQASIAAGGAPQEFPDFTEGEWKKRPRHEWPDFA